MEFATVSESFDSRIPAGLRERLGVAVGQRVAFVEADGRVELVPVRPVQELRCILPGVAGDFEREDDRI